MNGKIESDVQQERRRQQQEERHPFADIGALSRAMAQVTRRDTSPTSHDRRQMIADFFRLLGARFEKPASAPHPPAQNATSPPSPLVEPARLPCVADLPLRQSQTLQGLLGGDSEKQIAYKLGLSRHTVHVYVKALYKRFNVSSRGELLAKWVQPLEGSGGRATCVETK